MKRFIALALLISLSVPAYSAEKAPVLKAGAEQSKVKKVKPQKNKYEYINLAWWQQFNDEYLNDLPRAGSDFRFLQATSWISGGKIITKQLL